MAKSSNLKRLMELQEFLLEFQAIKRVVPVPGKPGEREDDAQHSYHLAIAGWFLSQDLDHLDTNKIIRYALCHDLVEIHAGDTYFYDEEAVKTKAAREDEAAKTIKAAWADFPDLADTIEGYQTLRDPEARFTYALDKIMPIMMITLDEGKIWHELHVTLAMLKAKKAPKVALSPEIVPYYEELIALLEKHPEYFGNDKRQ